ncbi:hypothetical protein Tco_0641224 [Tanacetum coccineum]
MKLVSYNREDVDQDDDDLAKERDLLASLIEKLKCEIDDSKNRNKLLESSNQTLVNKLKSLIDDFENKNKCLESSNNHFKEANTKLAKNNQLMFKDLKKFQAELDRYHDVNYASKVEIECAKAKGELVSHKMPFEKQADWKDDTDDEPEDQELEAHYLYMAKIHEVILDVADNSGPIFDTKPLQNVQHDDNDYNVFANERIHHEQPESDDDLARECDLQNVQHDNKDIFQKDQE